MKILELKRFKVDEAPTGVFVENGRVHFSAADRSQLFSFSRRTRKKSEALDTETLIPTGVSRDRKKVFFLDPASRAVFKTPEDRFEPEKVADLKNLDFGEANPALKATGAEVTDLCVRNKSLFCSVKAGYSSGVYEIDLATNKVKRFFFSSSPNPSGIVQHPKSKRFYIADGDSGFLAEFEADGRRTGNAAKLPTDHPHGLDIDAELNFFVGAPDTGDVVQFRLEEE